MGKIKKDSTVKESIPTKLNGVKKPLKDSKLKKTIVKRILEENDDIKKVKVKPGEITKTVDYSEFEQKFNINIQDVKTAIKSVIKFHKENPKLAKQLLADETFRICLTLCCHRIPTGNQKIIRIPLPHTLVTPSDDICLIVSELKGIKNKHDKHVEHYEELLARKEVKNIKKIMTMHEFRTEHETFEQLNRLVNLYDYFLVEGKISGKVVNKCGKIFYKKRKVPTSVKLQSTQLKDHIEKQLSKAYFHLHLKGNNYHTDFGHSQMDVSKIVENFVAVINYLSKEFPGGFDNIKGLNISTLRSTTIPVFVSTRNSSEIPKATVKFNNKIVVQQATDELSTQLNSVVTVKPTGEVLVTRGKRKLNTSVGNENTSILKEINKPSTSQENIGNKKVSTKKIATKDDPIKKQKASKNESTVANINIEKVGVKSVEVAKPIKKSKKKAKTNDTDPIQIKPVKSKKKNNKDKIVKEIAPSPSKDKIHKVQKVNHLHNEIIIEDLPDTPVVKKNKNKTVVVGVKKNKNKTVVVGVKKKKKSKALI